VADGLLTRQRFREVPPRVDYELTPRGHELMPILAALARWGFDWAWSPPRPGEAIDPGAIIRLAPGLLAPAASVRGTVELVVEPSDGDPARRYRLIAADGRVEVSETAEPPDAEADALVTGPLDAWVLALGPDGSAEELSATGDQALASAVLDGLTAAAAATRGVAAA
jgi:hypothetical protein